MAPAVTSTPVAAARDRRLQWHGEDVSLARVVTEVDRLHAELVRRDAADDAHPHPRNCVMNLVVVASSAQQAQRAMEAVDKVAALHPARALVLLLDESGEARLDCEIASTAHQLMTGCPVQCERVRLHVGGPAAAHLPSLVEPLLVPDVRTHFWWTGTPPLPDQRLLEALSICDFLIVDSAHFDRPYQSFRDLADLARSVRGRVALADFHWARLGPWRQVLAQFFAPADRRPFQEGINGVGIDYVGEWRANRVGAALMAGWLISGLGWKLKEAASGAGGVVAALFESARKHPVDLSFRSVSVPQLTPGEIWALRLEAAAGGKTCSLVMEREREQLRWADVRIQIGAGDPVKHLVPLEPEDEAQLLLDLLVGGVQDPVFLRSLDAAAELLQAL